jgi:hypothetical protein
MGRVKKKEHEKLSPENIKKVIKLLNADKPITKKEACSILNITYNTTRLARIIAEYEEHEAFIARRKEQNRGKPASKDEIAQTITDYLGGETISNIAKALFRSPGFIKAIIEKVGVPQRPTSAQERTKVSLIPESCRAETFEVGEVVWSAKYHSAAIIKKELPGNYEKNYLNKCYRIYVLEATDASDSFFPHIEQGGFNAVSLAYDLGKLKHLEPFGVQLNRL